MRTHKHTFPGCLLFLVAIITLVAGMKFSRCQDIRTFDTDLFKSVRRGDRLYFVHNSTNDKLNIGMLDLSRTPNTGSTLKCLDFYFQIGRIPTENDYIHKNNELQGPSEWVYRQLDPVTCGWYIMVTASSAADATGQLCDFKLELIPIKDDEKPDSRRCPKPHVSEQPDQSGSATKLNIQRLSAAVCVVLTVAYLLF